MSTSLAPPPPGGMAAGALVSVAAHAALLAGLALALHWRLPAPQPVTAELWSALPQSSAPPAPEARAAPPEQPAPPAPSAMPPPQPARRDAEIALEAQRQREREQAVREQAVREQAVREQAAAEKAAREQADRERALRQRALREKAEREKAERVRQAEEARLARQREENLKRLMGQIPAPVPGSGTGTGPAAAEAAPSAAYAGRLVQAIFPNIVFTESPPGNLAAVVEVRAAPNGTIIGRRLLSPSGHREWDEAVLRAIDRTGVLPRDADGRVPPVITVTFRPR